MDTPVKGTFPACLKQQSWLLSDDLTKRMGREIIPPPVWTEMFLGMSLYDWQVLAQWDVANRYPTTLRAANGSGKTTKVAGPLVLWLAHQFPGSQSVLTSGVYRQVKEQLYPAIKLHEHRFAGWKFNDTDFSSPQGSKCIGFSTDDAGLFEGWHARDHFTMPLMMVVDEGKSVGDAIYQAIDRCTYTMLLFMSSPGGPVGAFYESHKDPNFRKHKVTANDCPHLDKERTARIIAKYGAKHPVVQSMIYANFMETGGEGYVIPLSHLDRGLDHPPQLRGGERRGFCDFAAGGDENVFAERTGNRVRIVKAWHETDTMAAVGEFIRQFRQAGLSAQQIWADEGGLGKVMLDRLSELGWNLNRVNNNEASSDPEHYANIAAEYWDNGARKFERNEIIIDNDPELRKQLTSRKWKNSSDGKLKLESKEEMKKRGLSSPDRAEAVLGAMMPNPLMEATNFLGGDERISLEEDFEVEPVAGAFAG